MKLKLFDYIRDLTFDKKDLSRQYPEEFLETYSPYVINTVFSMSIDTLLYANEMNRFPDIRKQEHYDYYLFGLNKKRRQFKWYKAKNIEYLDDVCMYYQISKEKGLDLIRILSKENLDIIKEKLDKGGKSKKKRAHK